MMRPSDFFSHDTHLDPMSEMNGDPFMLSSWVTTEWFNVDLMDVLRRGPLPDREDLAVAIALVQLVHEELQAYGTSGSPKLTEEEITQALLALRSVLRRVGTPVDLPFRGFAGWRSYWLTKGASGSWQARRDLLAELFDPLHDRLVRMEDASFEALANPVSPRASTGWPAVDEEVRELRRRFQTSSTPQDYRAVGTHCIGVLEALSATVYDPVRHLRTGEELPAVDKTKQRIGRFIDDALPGPSNADLRKVATATIELAQAVKHGSTDTRRKAGIVSDAVILLANMLRRLDSD